MVTVVRTLTDPDGGFSGTVPNIESPSFRLGLLKSRWTELSKFLQSDREHANADIGLKIVYHLRNLNIGLRYYDMATTANYLLIIITIAIMIELRIQYEGIVKLCY